MRYKKKSFIILFEFQFNLLTNIYCKFTSTNSYTSQMIFRKPIFNRPYTPLIETRVLYFEISRVTVIKIGARISLHLTNFMASLYR